MADWGSRIVPPPMVPTSIEGMETETWRFPFTLELIRFLLLGYMGGEEVGTYFVIMVMQFADSTTCAGSCPVAKKMAATMLAA
jgi:hypothetical protein